MTIRRPITALAVLSVVCAPAMAQRDSPHNLRLQAGMEVETLVDGWRVFSPDPGPLAQHIAARSQALGLCIESLNTLSPTLEEVFVSITGGSHGRA